jgi:methylenetetrahydrofolate reductase (NADPH)
MAGTTDGQLSGHAPVGGLLGRALAAGELAVTAEITPPRGADTGPVTRTAALLRDWVHAVNITDNAGAAVRLAGWGGCLAALAAGVEPIMQLTTRDRNRIALQSELLAASAAGVPSVLIMTGDHPRQGDHPDAAPVFDLDGAQLLRVARIMRDEGRLMSGRTLDPPPSWLIGGVTDPSGPADAAAGRLAVKVEAGAQFVQTQYVFDVPAFARWLDRIGELGLLDRCRVLAGVGPVLSQRALDHLGRLPGVHIPEAAAARLQAAGAAGPEQFRAAGEQLCAETIAALAQVPGVAGVHVFAPGGASSIPRILRQAGLRPRRPTQGAGAGTAGPDAAGAAGATGTSDRSSSAGGAETSDGSSSAGAAGISGGGRPAGGTEGGAGHAD